MDTQNREKERERVDSQESTLKALIRLANSQSALARNVHTRITYFDSLLGQLATSAMQENERRSLRPEVGAKRPPSALFSA